MFIVDNVLLGITGIQTSVFVAVNHALLDIIATLIVVIVMTVASQVCSETNVRVIAIFRIVTHVISLRGVLLHSAVNVTTVFIQLIIRGHVCHVA